MIYLGFWMPISIIVYVFQEVEIKFYASGVSFANATAKSRPVNQSRGCTLTPCEPKPSTHNTFLPTEPKACRRCVARFGIAECTVLLRVLHALLAVFHLVSEHLHLLLDSLPEDVVLQGLV